MLEIPRYLFIEEKSPSGSAKTKDMPQGLNNTNYEERIALTTLDDIKWATNMLEPSQQRGPSENP